jgi:hypothetical protein
MSLIQSRSENFFSLGCHITDRQTKSLAEETTMNKKNMGIAAILVVILLIAIGIAKANTQVGQVQLHDQDGFALSHLADQRARVLLPDLYVTPAPETLNTLETGNTLVTWNKLEMLDNLELSGAVLRKVPSVSLLTKSFDQNSGLGAVLYDRLQALELHT